MLSIWTLNFSFTYYGYSLTDHYCKLYKRDVKEGLFTWGLFYTNVGMNYLTK